MVCGVAAAFEVEDAGIRPAHARHRRSACARDRADSVVLLVPDRPKKIAESAGSPMAWLAVHRHHALPARDSSEG